MAKGKEHLPLARGRAAATVSYGFARTSVLERSPQRPDPDRQLIEFSTPALWTGGFEARDQLAQIAARPDALLRLQQLAGNDFVTKTVAPRDLAAPAADLPP